MLANSVTRTPVEWVIQSNITSRMGWRRAWDGSTWGLSLFSAGIRQGIERVKGGPPGDHTSRAALVFTESYAASTKRIGLSMADAHSCSIMAPLECSQPGSMWTSSAISTIGLQMAMYS